MPIACLYSPLKERDDLPPVLYEPVTCKAPACRAILNVSGWLGFLPFAQELYSHTAKLTCAQSCGSVHSACSATAFLLTTKIFRPPTFLPSFCQSIRRSNTHSLGLHKCRPIFLFVVDTCLDEDDLKALKDSIVVSLSLLPPHALVGLITYGTMVRLFVPVLCLSLKYGTRHKVHELGYQECPKSFVFRGTKEYTSKHIQDMLSLSPAAAIHPGPSNGPPPLPGSARFLLLCWAMRVQLDWHP